MQLRAYKNISQMIFQLQAAGKQANKNLLVLDGQPITPFINEFKISTRNVSQHILNHVGQAIKVQV